CARALAPARAAQIMRSAGIERGIEDLSTLSERGVCQPPHAANVSNYARTAPSSTARQMGA
ncbi:MAG: hypothetical protein M3N82_18430, partial [Pseudomonadota bacterium]|nr:hypothetical protein [Pseudomonadota bacterium]